MHYKMRQVSSHPTSTSAKRSSNLSPECSPSPPQHPLYPWIRRAHDPKWQKLSFPSNLINIAKHFPECMHDLETIIPYIRPPWWSQKASIHIDADKEIAEAHHLHTTSRPNDNSAHIYTDGSGINDGIGAAMYCHTDQHGWERAQN